MSDYNTVHVYEGRCAKININFVDRGWFGWFIVLNATFNNNSVIPWRSVLLVEETGGPAENHRPVTSH